MAVRQKILRKLRTLEMQAAYAMEKIEFSIIYTGSCSP